MEEEATPDISEKEEKYPKKKERGHPSLRSTVSVFAIYLR